MSLALAVVVVGLGLVGGLVGTVLDSANGTVELVADGVAVLGLFLVGAALSLLGVTRKLVGGPVDVVLDGVDGGLDEAPVKRGQFAMQRRGMAGGEHTRPERWCWKTW